MSSFAVGLVLFDDLSQLAQLQAGPLAESVLFGFLLFELLVRGHTNASIGRMLGISPKTVDTHRTKVLRKIGVHSIVDLVRFAARNQLPLD